MRATVAPAGTELCARVGSGPPGALVAYGTTNAPGATISLQAFPLTGGLGAHKWADRSLLDAAQTRLPDDALPLIVDDGAALEASRANVFAVRDGALFTPPLDGRILPGVTRMRAIELATTVGLDVCEAELRRDDLLVADEVFLTGSVRGVERVGAIDGTRLSTEGDVTTGLADALRRVWLDTGAGSRLAVG